jgi:predicted DNA-binding transcriptional regulator AlpA
MSEFLTRAELAHRLRVSVQTLSRWLKDGNKLPPPLRVGHRMLWERAAIESFLVSKAK